MRFYFFALIGLLLLSTTALAVQIDVVAKVLRDADGSPIQGATVTYATSTSNFAGGTTNSQGIAQYHVFLEEGTQVEITASHQDYEGHTITFNVPSSNPYIKEIRLDDEDNSDNDNGNNDEPRINNLPDQFIDEDDGFQNNLIDLWDYTNDDEDSDSELSFSISESNSGLINCFIDADRYIDCYGPGEDETGSSRVTVTVRDSDYETDSDIFTVYVGEDEDNNDNDNDFCSEINIDTDNITIQENRTTVVRINVDNDSSRDFEIEQVTIIESSPHFSVFPLDDDFTIDEGESEDIRLEFVARNISDDEDESIRLSIVGEFSNGHDCDLGEIEEEIDVSVNNNSFDNQVNISIIPQTIELERGQTKTVNLLVENEFSSRKCFELDTTDTQSGITVQIADNDFCINSRDEKETQIIVSALSNAQAQTHSVQLEAEYNNGTKFAFFNVKVNQPEQAQARELKITGFEQIVFLQENQTKAVQLTITNDTETDFTNISIGAKNLPNGVFFEPVYIAKLEAGQVTTISTNLQTTSLQSGTFTATLELDSSQGKTTKQFTIRTPQEQESTDDPATGFAGLLTSAGTAVILLLILVALIFIIVMIFRKK